MGNKCCKSQSSAYSSANATIRSFSSYNSSVAARSGGSHAITFENYSRGNSLTTLAMKSTNDSDVGKDYRGGSSSTIGQEDPIPVFLRRLNDLNIRVGTRTRFLIELDDATGVQVRWYHNNLEADSDRYQYIHEGGFYCLDIVPVTLEDEGLWVCTAQNYAGKSSTAARLSLTVPKAFKKPFFVEQLRAVLTQCGIVSLECKVIGVPTPKLRWYKDDKEIKAGDIFALTASSSEDCLGVYTCEATNVMGTALSTSKIQVTHMRFDGGGTCYADSLVPRGPPPKFVNVLKDASGKVGSVLFLQCQVEVPPWPKSVEWYNDKGVVTDGTLYRLIADGLGVYGVEIKSLRADHGTTWKCVVTSTSGAKAVTSCSVTVSHPKNYRVPRFLESLRAVMTEEGLVSFECKVIGYPAPQLCWFKDGKQLQPGDVYELTGSKSLGSYCCVAQNCMGEASSVAELTIEDIQNQLNESEKLQLTSNTQPPRFLVGLRSAEANINESFVFMIKVITESTPSISWYKEDEQIEESNRYRFSSEDNGTFILNVVPLEIDDQAEWKCVAINKFGQTVTSSFLKLNVPKNFKPPRFLDELRIAFSNEGSVNLECKVIGVPQPQLKWFKDGQELNPGDMHKIISGQSGTCCLGTYTCQAHNCMGTVSSSATLLTMEDKSTVKSTDEYLSVDNPLVRNESLSTIPEERTSQMEKSYTIEEPADVSFSFDGKEVTVSLYETPDLTHDEALQIIEMYADELSEHISEDNVVDLPSLRIVKQSSISGPVMMEALVIDVPVGFCQQQTVSDTEFDGVSLSEDATLANNDKSDAELCENSLEYYSDHLSSSNSKRDVFYSASETTPKNSSSMLKPLSDDDDGHQPSFRTPRLFMSDSDDQVLTQLNADGKTSRNVASGRFARSESNNTEEEVSETLAEVENEYSALPHNYCAAEILAQSDEDGLYATVLNKIRHGGMDPAVALSTEEDNVFNIISRPNVDEFLKYMKIILEGTVVKMHAHEGFRNFTDTPTELERSIQALHSLAWKFVEETERDNATVLDKHTADNVSSLMTAINASLLALEQIDDPFGVSDNVLNEIQSSVCFDLQTLNDKELPAAEILHRLSDQIKDFTAVVNRQVARVTEQRVAAVLRNTIGTTLMYVKTLQQNISKIKCINVVDSLASLFAMVQPLETIVQDIAAMEEEAASIDDTCEHSTVKLKQMLIPPISSIAFHLDNLNAALRNENPEDDHDLNDIYDRINVSATQFMALASHGTAECNNLAECFVSFTKPINDLCCYLRRPGRSTENIVSSDYGSDDKLLMDFETLFDELMMDIDTLINNVNVVRDSENNVNPLGSLLEPLQDMKIGLFQINQVLLSNQTGSNMSYEVVSCFEHLSQQLVQLNNCIVNQSIVEETDKEIPFESSIKMMQKILFDDAIDDLGVNGILFGSVMKPLLQLQNLIVSKMASVESDLSFSEYTDASGSACGTRSLSLSLSNNAQTVLDKADNPKQTKTKEKKTEEETAEENGNVNNASSLPGASKDSALVESNNAKQHDLNVKRGFECDIGATFRDEEPNIIMPEDDRENTGFEVLFDETDFVEDEYLDDVVRCLLEKATSDSFMDEENVDLANDNIIPKPVLESFDESSQQDPTIVNYSSTDLFDELQETLRNISEGSLSENVNELSSKITSGDQLDEPLEVDKMKKSIVLASDDELIEHEVTHGKNTGVHRNNDVISKPDELDFVEIEKSSISDDNTSLQTPQNDRSSEDLDKSISNDNTVTNNVISEIKTEETDNVSDLDTKINVLRNSSGQVQREELVFKKENVSDESCSTGVEITSLDFKNPNELDNLNTSESIDYLDNSSGENSSQGGKSFEKANVVCTDVTDANQVVYSSIDSTVVDAKLSADADSLIKNENLHVLTSHEDEPSTVVVDEDDSQKSRSQAEVIIVTEGSDVSALEKMDIDVDVFVQPTSQVSDENQVIAGIDKQSITNIEDTETKFKKSSSSAVVVTVIEGRVDETKENDSAAVVVVSDEKLNHSIVTEILNETEQSTPLSVNNDIKRVDVIAEEVVEERDVKSTSRSDIDSIIILTDDSAKKPKEFNENSYGQIEINEEDKISREEDDSQSAVEKISTADIENVSDSSTITDKNVERKSLIDNEVNAVDGLNDSCQNVPNTNENAQTAIVEECVLDGSKHMISDTKRDDENRDELSVAESEILVADSEVLDEQLKEKKDDVHRNAVANNEPAMNVKEYEKPIEKNISLNNDGVEEDVGVKSEVELEIAIDPLINRQNEVDEKTSENLKKESSTAEVNNENDESVQRLDEAVGELKRATVLEHNGVVGADICEVVETIQCDNLDGVQVPLISSEENNALINVEVITADSTQLMDTREFDENQVVIKYEGDESRETTATYEEKIVLDGENSKTEEEVKIRLAVEEHISSEADDAKEDTIRPVDDCQNVISSVEQDVALTCEQVISVGSAGDVEKADSFQNVEAKQRVSESQEPVVLENVELEGEKKIEGHCVCNDDEEKTRTELPISVKDDLTCVEDKIDECVTKENSEIQTSKCSDENEIKTNDILRLESGGEIFESELLSDESVGIHEADECEKTPTEIETIKSKTETENDMSQITTHCSVINYLPCSEHDQIEDFDNVENVSGDHKCSLSIEENAAVNSVEVVTADFAPIMSLKDVRFENSEVNYANEQKPVAECRTVVVLENVDDLNESNSNGDGFETVDDEPIGQTSRVSIEESEAIVNEEVVLVDSTRSLESYDAKLETVNEKLTESLVDGVEVTELNVFRSSVVGDRAPNTEEAAMGTIELETVADHVPRGTVEENEFSKLSAEESDVMVHAIDKADIHAIPNENDVSKTELLCGEKVDEERVKIEEQKEIQIEKFESETTMSEVKANDEIDVSALEKTASIQNDVVSEDEIAEFSFKENTELSAVVKPKLHCVEIVAANQTECVMLESANVLTRDERDDAEKVIERASVGHELNIAAIGNMVIDYDSLKENDGSNEENRMENATLAAVVDERSNEILSKNVQIFKAPDKDFTVDNGDGVTVTNDSDEANKDSVRITRFAKDDSVEKLSDELNEEVVLIDALKESSKKAKELVEPVGTSSDIVSPLDDREQIIVLTKHEVENDVVSEVTKDERIEDTNGKSDLQKKSSLEKEISSNVSANSISVNDNEVGEKLEKLETEIEEENTLQSFRNDEMENQKNNKLNGDNTKTLSDIFDPSDKPGQTKELILDEIKNDVRQGKNDERIEKNTLEKAGIKKKSSPKKEKSSNISECITEIENKVDEEIKVTEKLETKLKKEIGEENDKTTQKSLRNDEIGNEEVNKLDTDQIKSSSDIIDPFDEPAQTKEPTSDEVENDVCKVTKDERAESKNEKSDIKKKSSPKKKKSSISESTTENKVDEKTEKLETKLETEIGEENDKTTQKSLRNDEIENEKLNKLDGDHVKSSSDIINPFDEHAQTKEPTSDEVENDMCKVICDDWTEDTKEKGDVTRLSVDVVDTSDESRQTKEPTSKEIENDVVCEITKAVGIRKKSSSKEEKLSNISECISVNDNKINEEAKVTEEKPEKLETKLETKISEENDKSNPKSLQNEEIESQKINKLDDDQMKLEIVDISDEPTQTKKSTLDEIKNDVVCEVIKEEGANGKSDIKKKSSLKKKKSSITSDTTVEIECNVTEEKVEKLETKLEKEIGEENSKSTSKSLGYDEIENQTMNKLDVDEMKSSADIANVSDESNQPKEITVSEVENVACEVTKDERIEEDTNVKCDIKNKSSPKTKTSPNAMESAVEMENKVIEKLERKLETENEKSTPKSFRDDEVESVKYTEFDVGKTSIKEVGEEKKKRGSKTKRTKVEMCSSPDKSTKTNDDEDHKIEENTNALVDKTGKSSEENRIDIDTPTIITITENDERTMDGNRDASSDEIAVEEERKERKSMKSKSRDKYWGSQEKWLETDGKPSVDEITDESRSIWQGDAGGSDRVKSADRDVCPPGDSKWKRSVDVTEVRKRDDRTRQLDFGGKRSEKTLAEEGRIGGVHRVRTAPSYSCGRYLDVTDAYGGRSSMTRFSSRSLTPEPKGGSWNGDGCYTRSSEREIANDGCCGVRGFDSSRLSARYLSPVRGVYRCPSETSIRPLSYRYRPEEHFDAPTLRYYGSMGRGGSDSFLHDLRDGPHCSSRRLPETTRRSTYTAEADLNRTKETFKRLYFCVRLIDQTVSSGTRVKFWCSVIGYPEPCVQWYRDGQKLNSFSYNSSTRYATKYADGLAQFVVENAQSCDSGEYSCVAFNSRDRISTTGFLTVYTSPSMFGAPKRPVESSTVHFDSLYAWNGDDFRHGGNKSLTGYYYHRGWHTSDDVASRSPKYPKFVTGIIADDVATYGGTIAFHVRVQGSPLPNVTWMRESKPLPRLSAKYVYLNEGGLYTLLVKDSTARDGGTYVCRACNLYGSADAEKSVRVVSLQDFSEHRGVKPAIIVSRPNDRLNVAVGEDITVTLRVAGEPKPKVIWMRGARDVTFLDRSLKETVNDYVVLSIKKAQLSDAGTYFIIAKNVYGSDRAFVTVGVRKRARSLTPPQIRNTIDRRRLRPRRVFGGCAVDYDDDDEYGASEVPGPIRSEPTVSDRANNRISLTWDKPEKAENALVYMVETRSSAEEEECWKQVGMTLSNFIDVYNLKPGNRYKFRVTARNRFGWGRPVATADYVDVSEPKYLPEFRQPLPGETKVLSRHTATLQCHVRGFPKPRVTWYKDGEPLALINGKHVIACTEMGRCTLTIADAAQEDAGRYACEAINDQGRVCTLTVVEVMANRRIVEAERRLQGCLMKNNDFKESAPIFTKRLTDRTVEINSTVRLSCQVNGLPAPSITWYKDGRPIDPKTAAACGQTSSRDSDNFSTLELTGVKYDDSGAYTAFASNPIGTATTRCVLEVINRNRTDPAIPEFVFDLPPVHEAVDSIILNAQVDAYRPIKVEWFRDGVRLRNGRRVDIVTDHDGKLELRIAGVTKRDSGTYALRVSNDTGAIESRCEVDVVERKSYDDTGTEQISSMTHLYSKKPKFVVKPKFQEVEEGQEVIIDSEIVGDPLPEITWLRDGLKCIAAETMISSRNR